MYSCNTLQHVQVLRTIPFPPSLHPSPSILRRIRCSVDGQGSEDFSRRSIPASLDITPDEIVEIRLRRSSKRRRKLQNSNNEIPKLNNTKAENAAAAAPKRWDDMSLSEKVLELYAGEKGLLFWLNKFAYASIFIVIGGWILFRFVGPALNLYQLDSPPLSPDSMLKGSP